MGGGGGGKINTPLINTTEDKEKAVLIKINLVFILSSCLQNIQTLGNIKTTPIHQKICSVHTI